MLSINSPQKRKITKEALRRFPDSSLHSLARYLVANYPEVYNSNTEEARASLKYYTGKDGDLLRKSALDKSLFRGKYIMPKSRASTQIAYDLFPGLWLVLSDIHVPFHSEKAIESTLKYGKLQKPDGILINGDMQDCYSLSYWYVPYKRDFVKEVEQLIDFLDFLKGEFPDIPIIWKPGNHEDRLERYYRTYAPQLADLPDSDLPTILSLPSRGIIFLDRKQKIMAGKLPVLHGHEIRGGNANLVNPARWLFLKAKHSAVVSHFHRTSTHAEKNIMKKDIATWSFGCLCSLEPDYNPEANNWNNGFGMINVEKNGDYEVENLKIFNTGRIV